MSEVFLPLLPTFVLAIYLFYVIFCESSRQLSAQNNDETILEENQSEPTEQETAVVSVKMAVVSVKDAQKPIKELTSHSIKPSKEKPFKNKVTDKKTEIEVTQNLGTPDYFRNPQTDELAPVPNNYRFAKRWIKTALVEERLLDKIYRNNEMDEENSVKVKKALQALAQLPQYRG